MTDDLAAALERGGTLVTAGARLAHAWRREYGSRQLAAGRSAWLTPSILPWPVFVERLWEEQARGTKAPPLTPVQEQALWESIIEGSPESANLIQPSAAARLAGEAWRLIHEWRIPFSETTAEASAFRGWAQQFEFHTQWRDRTDSARLPEGLEAPKELWLTGFDELTPRQKRFLSGSEIHQWEPRVAEAAACLAAFENGPLEEEAAAEWCRRRLESNPGARIGVVVQDLEQRRVRIERVFRIATPGAFHIALGPPLSARPLIAAALRMLEFGGARVDWDTASSLLLSPWVTGFTEERSARAAFEVALRRWRTSELTAISIARQHACPPILSRALWRADSLRREWPEELKPSDWAAAFRALLDVFGWPGDATLNSVEYQMRDAWRATLSDLASTDLASGAVSRLRALRILRRLAEGKRFEAESTGEPIQVLSMGEAAGASFDHLWIAGMNDEEWPARPSPNPFVPIALQRRHNLPHSSPARELAFASRVSKRLLQSASEIVVSYAKADSERETGPSPLFSHLPMWRGKRMTIAPARSVEFERMVDDQGPPVEVAAMTSGGTRALELQAKCPFRAFAEIRLSARELESPEPGFDPRERGAFLHAALEHFFRRFPSTTALKVSSAEAISQGLAEGVDLALAKCKVGDNELAGKLVELERVRLIELLESWIELEKQREIEFTVEEPEQERTVEIGGIKVQVRLDRLDRLATGAYALIDYKSRAPRLGDWDGERPESPQLAIYAVTAREPLAAIAFAQVRTGANAFKGYSTIEGALPGMKPVDPAVLSTRIDEWRRVFEILGRDFREGQAAVDPKIRFKTCDLCHLSSLCRVKEK